MRTLGEPQVLAALTAQIFLSELLEVAGVMKQSWNQSQS